MRRDIKTRTQQIENVRSVSQIMHEPFAIDYNNEGTRNVNKKRIIASVGLNSSETKMVILEY